MAKEPLIQSRSELSYGFEPHDQFYPWCGTGVDVLGVPGCGGEGCTRGAARWVLGGYYTGYPAGASFDAYLMNY